MQGSLLDKMKNNFTGDGDGFEPVVDTTMLYGARLEHGIEKRAQLMKTALDDLISNNSNWTMMGAISFQWSFLRNCPFISDMPTDTDEDGGFMKDFQKQSELQMWIEWALVRDEKFWNNHWANNDYWGIAESERKLRGEKDSGGVYDPGAMNTLLAMSPVMDRLIALGVPLYEIASGNSGYSAFLDMRKTIKWAKREAKRTRLIAPTDAAAQVCKAADSHLLKLRKRENVSYPDPVVCYPNSSFE